MVKINRKISFTEYANMHRNLTKLIQWGVKTDVHACAYFNIYQKYKLCILYIFPLISLLETIIYSNDYFSIKAFKIPFLLFFDLT